MDEICKVANPKAIRDGRNQKRNFKEEQKENGYFK